MAALTLVSGEAPTVEGVYAEHADFLWASLHRLGVRDADRPDALQDVLVVVHRKLPSWDRRSKLTTWLFGICLKVAAAHRRKAHVRRERLVAEAPPGEVAGDGPDGLAERRSAAERLARVLDEMGLERRVVLVMFELEERPCEEIAAMLGVPVGTVHSRLHAARRELERCLARLEAREAHARERAARERGTR